MSKLQKLAELPKVAMDLNNYMFDKAEPIMDEMYEGTIIKPVVCNPVSKAVSKYCIMYPTLVTIGAIAIMRDKM